MSQEPDLPKLSFWMAGAENSKLGKAAQGWFSLLADAAFWVANRLDPLACPEKLLDLIAWQRGVSRYSGEPNRLYRLRVAYAYANGKDAGSIEGWQRIFKRLELGPVELEERKAGQDWDIIGVIINDAAFAVTQDVQEIIINEYGRTCRRYRFISRITQGVRVRVGTFDDDHATVCAVQANRTALITRLSVGFFDNEHATVEAKAWA